MAEAKVRQIYLVHGTLAGTDASGLVGELDRVMPKLAATLRVQQKWIVDMIARDWGNYDDSFARTLRDGINDGLSTDQEIRVRRFMRSSENHGVGRAHAAVRLLHRLVTRKVADDDRIVLIGHSHAGNVFALLTNLLAADIRTRHRFFSAMRPYYRVMATGKVDIPVFGIVRDILMKPGNPLGKTRLDIVTMGAPIRYGWDTDGYSQLLHFVHHVPDKNLPDFMVAFPPKLDQVTQGASGDFFQQFFITGTNFPPNLIAWRTWNAERRLRKLIQPGFRRRDLWEHLKLGMRVANEGRTLLVDYRHGNEDLARQMAGHAVYTRQEFLPFHLEQMVARLYPQPSEVVDA
jgi:hypothetical protein